MVRHPRHRFVGFLALLVAIVSLAGLISLAQPPWNWGTFFAALALAPWELLFLPFGDP